MKGFIAALASIGLWTSSAAAQGPIDDLTAAVSPPGTTASLTWTGIPGDETGWITILYEVRYSTAPITLDNWSGAEIGSGHVTVDTTTGVRTMEIAGLDWNTTWYFAVVILQRELSNVASITTPLEPDLVAPAAVQLSAAASSGSVILTWHAPGDDDMTGTAAQYDLRYSPVGPISSMAAWNDPTTVIVDGMPAPALAGTSQSITLDDLVPNQVLHFCLRSADEEPNWSRLSDSLPVLVLPDQAAPAAVPLDASGATSDSITLAWTAPGDDGMSGRAAGYDLRVSTGRISSDADFASATPVPGLPAPLAAGSPHELTVIGLLPNMPYHFALRSRDEAFQWSATSLASASTGHVDGSFGRTNACSCGGSLRPLLLAWILVLILPVLRTR